MLGWGMIGTGLSLLDRSLAQPPTIKAQGSLDAEAQGSHVAGYGEEAPTHWSSGASDTLDTQAALRATASHSEVGLDTTALPAVSGAHVGVGSPDPTAANAGADPFSDVLADPFVDVLSGESLRQAADTNSR